MTCIVPSLRFVVPSIEAVAPPPACGLPCVVTAGQFCRQAPLYVLVGPVSLWNR